MFWRLLRSVRLDFKHPVEPVTEPFDGCGDPGFGFSEGVAVDVFAGDLLAVQTELGAQPENAQFVVFDPRFERMGVGLGGIGSRLGVGDFGCGFSPEANDGDEEKNGSSRRRPCDDIPRHD